MKGLAFLIFKIALVIVAILCIMYFFDVPITEVAGERIGFADLVNFFLMQPPPNLAERSMKNDTVAAALASKLNGADLGGSAVMLSRLGNPIKFCVFRDYNYCQNFRIDGSRIYETGEGARKTVYVSYGLAMELKTRADSGNFGDMEKRLIVGIKSGDVKGLTIADMMSLGG